MTKVPFLQNIVHVDTTMTPSLSNMDICGHMVNPLPPLPVHVVIECPHRGHVFIVYRVAHKDPEAPFSSHRLL